MRATGRAAARMLGTALAACALAGCRTGTPAGSRSGVTDPPAALAAAPAPASDPAAGLDLVTANRTAIALLESGHSFEGLPYFRRQLALAPPGEWAPHQDYANALHNAALQPREARGIVIQACRANDDRIALMVECFEQFDLAERLAHRPHDRATVRWARGHKFDVWGMPWDARAQYRLALADDPRFEVVRQRARDLERIQREASGPPR